MALTFIDSGVLIAAVRGTGDIARRAMEVLDDPQRTFASSPFVRLEVLPKALFHGKDGEAAFYRAFFEVVQQWAEPGPGLVDQAFSEAARGNLAAQDALHVAAAAAVGAEELITTEKVGKPIFGVRSVKVRTIHP